MTITAFSDELAQVRTKKKEFLEQIERIVPWNEWVAMIKPCYYKGERGNKPYDLELMLRLYLIQNLYNLADEATVAEVTDGLTGTHASNGLMDLWAEFRLLDMGQRLGRFIGKYRTDYFLPDRRNGNIVYSYRPLPDAEQQIYDKISDITISMKSTDHLNMPELIISEYTVKLSEEERQHYEELKEELVLELPDGDVTASNAGSLSNKLSQMANGAIYSDDRDILPIHDRKLDALEDIIEAANGKPVLVAYWFKHDLARIQERLNKLHIPFATMDKADSISRWQRGELPVGLIHPASAGHGLNLQSGGSTLIWFGLTWSLELYQQTNARLWRQGQQSKTVIIQHIITTGTIDRKIMSALQKKEETQNALIDAVKAELGGKK